MSFAGSRLFALGLSILATAAAHALERVLGIDISETAVFIASGTAFLGVFTLSRIFDRLAPT